MYYFDNSQVYIINIEYWKNINCNQEDSRYIISIILIQMLGYGNGMRYKKYIKFCCRFHNVGIMMNRFCIYCLCLNKNQIGSLCKRLNFHSEDNLHLIFGKIRIAELMKDSK